MAVIPSHSPSAALQGRILPHLIRTLPPSATQIPVGPHAEYPISPEQLSNLRIILRILASQSLVKVTELRSSQYATDSSNPSSRLPYSPTLPLQLLLRIPDHHLTVETLLDCIIAYRNLPSVVNSVVERVPAQTIEEFREVVTSITMRLASFASTKTKPNGTNGEESDLARIGRAVITLLSIVRSHPLLLALVLEEASGVFPSLGKVYAALNDVSTDGQGGERILVLQIKEYLLFLVHTLLDKVRDQLASHTTLKSLLTVGPEEGRTLLDMGLKGDYEAIFERGEIGDEEREILHTLREVVTQDPRVEVVLSLFPHLPPKMIVSALNHPRYSSSSSSHSPEEAAAPLIEAILGGGIDLPPELADLKATLCRDLGPNEGRAGAVSASVTNNAGSDGQREKERKDERRNIWDAELDMSRLKLGKDDTTLPQLGNAIPDHLRESILRLVESQEEEAAAQEAAIAEAHAWVTPSDGERVGSLTVGNGVRSGSGRRSEIWVENTTLGDETGLEDDAAFVMMMAASGESSEPDETSGSHKITRKPRNAPTTQYNVDQQTRLELAYLTNPALFDRDANTRRSEKRKKLKEETGLDDSQLEGWRIHLERNPHKEAILARHQYIPIPNNAYLPEAPESSASHISGRGRGGGRGRSRGRGHSWGGSTGGHLGDISDGGSRGGGSGNERGGGRGRGEHGGGGRGRGGRGRGENKGSRGHQNQTRTRGHDRKMGKMGVL
ncbi:hypothetical protein M231_03088 [Tremella mesenterica]|uniref:CUE domain-containing protein n=1 Tax=Tremella mesenterica TaxID=5217 RepID=A0A4Q1BNX5_TREME|nr:hypothetical protein M231_03088 [Tremella mesenterica]